jgi:hypothetical protein
VDSVAVAPAAVIRLLEVIVEQLIQVVEAVVPGVVLASFVV